MTDLEKVQEALNNAIDYLKDYEHLTVGKEIKTELGHAKTLVENLAIHDVSNAERTLAIKFADALLNDFEMSEFENETLCWRLCGVPHKYTTSEVYDRYVDEILANDC